MDRRFEQGPVYQETRVEKLLRNRTFAAVLIGAGKGAFVGALVEVGRQRDKILDGYNPSEDLNDILNREADFLRSLDFRSVGKAALTFGVLGGAEAIVRLKEESLSPKPQ